MKILSAVCIGMGFLFSGVVASAQQAGDAAAIRDHVSTARELADERYSRAMERLCAAPEDRARPSFDDLNVEPARIFDNLYFLGLANVYSWAVDTSEGIILLDSLNDAGDAENTIAAGLRKFGLDPARVRYVVVSHGHGDHFGGAAYFQQNHGARVVASEADWNLIEQAESRSDERSGIRRDIVASDGHKLTLGDTTLTLVLTPGHTPGALSVIVPVRDRGTPHMAALLNGPRITSLETARQMVASTEKLARIGREVGVDVELNNHSYIDDSLPIIEAARERGPGQANPFVIGTDGFQRFVGWQIECLKADVIRLEQ